MRVKKFVFVGVFVIIASLVFSGCDVLSQLLGLEYNLTVKIVGGGIVEINGEKQSDTTRIYHFRAGEKVNIRAVNVIGKYFLADPVASIIDNGEVSSFAVPPDFRVSSVFTGFDISGEGKVTNKAADIVMDWDRSITVYFDMYKSSTCDFKYVDDSTKLFITFRIDMAWDDEGNLLEMKKYDSSDGSLVSDAKFKLVGNTLAEIDSYDGSGDMTDKTKYNYDGSGSLSSSVIYSYSEGSLSSTTKCLFSYLSDGKWSRLDCYDYDILTGSSSLAKYFVFDYDTEGNLSGLTKHIISDGTDTISEYYEFKYDSEGQLTEVEDYDNKGDVFPVNRLKYVYDDNGLVKEIDGYSVDSTSGDETFNGGVMFTNDKT